MNYRISLCALLVILISQEQVSANFPYENEPSSTTISSNPYGSSLKLNCTIKVPEGLTRYDVNILWYRSQSNTAGKCQINIASRCGISPFSAPHLDPLVATSYFSKPLLLRTVSNTAIGCYWCRSFKCSDTYCTKHEPLGDLSAPFCLKAETHYKQRFNKTLIEFSTSVNNQPTSTSTISPAMSTQGIFSTTAQIIAPAKSTLSLPSSYNAGSSAAEVSLSTSKLYLSSLSPLNLTRIPFFKEQTNFSSTSSAPSMSPTTVMKLDESVPIQWLFVSLVVCAILAISTCVLTPLIIYRCFKRRASKYRTTVITSPGDFNGKDFTNIVACRPQALSDDYYECHNPGTLTQGGYFLVKQVDSDQSTSTHPTLSKIGNIFKTATDEATEEPFYLSDDQAAQYEAYGYSHPPPPRQQPPDYCTMTNPSDFGYSIPKNPPVPATNIYDTPTQQEDDYVYAYAQIRGTKESSQETKKETSIGDLCEEVLDLVGKGAYEVDPHLAFVVQTEKRRQMVKEGHYQLPPSRVVDDDSDDAEKKVQETGSHNPYQSLDSTQLADENTYYTVMK